MSPTHLPRGNGGIGRPQQTKALPASGAWTPAAPVFERRFFPVVAVPRSILARPKRNKSTKTLCCVLNGRTTSSE